MGGLQSQTNRSAQRSNFRRATISDAEAISSLLRRAFQEFVPLYTPEAFVATVQPASDILTRMEEGPLWVAESDRLIIGTVSAVRSEEFVVVRGMAVASEARGQKIGRALLGLTEEYAREQSVDRIALYTTPFLLSAIRLYQSYGFRFSGEKASPHGTELFRMIKVLDNSAGHL
jgi:N-acetylglutamate synthase-like GNAT family acetyltransferase